MKTVTLQIEGMTCEQCARILEGALQSAFPSAQVDVSYPRRNARVSLPPEVSEEQLLEAILQAGYQALVSREGRSISGGLEEGARKKSFSGGAGEGSGGRLSGGEGGSSTGRTAVAGKGPGGSSFGMRPLLIIGAGSAAFAAAIRAAELGAPVMLVEKGVMGGTCVNVGCVPSKTLLKAAETAYHRRHHPFAGIPKGNGMVDLPALVSQKGRLVEQLREEKYWKVLAAYPSVEYVEGKAAFVDPATVRIHLAAGGDREVRPSRVIVATGASPWVPPIPGLEKVPYWTNVEALEAQELPERLVVVGGSAVGVELAQLFSRLGSRVSIVEVLPTLVPNEDPQLGEALQRCFEEEGIEVYTGARMTSVSRRAGDGYRLEVEVAGQKRVFSADRLLMATGRRAQTRELNLPAAEVETDEKGFIRVDEFLRTSHPHIYAAGDCTNLPQFVYVAARAGTLAAENALNGDKRRLDLSSMPAVTFTDPQVASVGWTEEGARKRGLAVESRVLSFQHVPRALANRDTRGLAKIVCRRQDGRILGVHLLSPAAGEVIQTAVLAIQGELTVAQLADTLFPYLTEVEGLKLAAQTFQKNVSQLSCCAG